jgi:hypothetical protein
MAQASRLGTVLLLALTPSACTVLDGLSGLTGGGDDASGDVVAPDAPADTPDVGTTDTSQPGPESGADAPRDVGRETQPESSTVDVTQDTTPPPDVTQEQPLAYFQVVAADMPLAYYRLDEASGTTAHDVTGHGNDGTYTGGYTLGVPGAIANDADTAASFDGNTGYVDVKNAFAFAGKVPFTLEAWLKPSIVDTNYRCWMSKNDNATGPSEGYLAFVDASISVFSFQRVDSGTKITAQSNTAAVANTWWYVVITYDPMAGSIVYVNAQGSTPTTNDVTLAGATTDFVIGAENGGATAWWAGAIDEVAVYGYALSAAQVANHYTVGTGQ